MTRRSRRRVVVDCGAPKAASHGVGWAVVAVDVFRATTTATTAVASGRRCLPAGSVEHAHALAAQLDQPLLAGEQRGEPIAGFDLGNSPALIAERTDLHRPLVLLTTCGTPLLTSATRASAVYAASLRNISAQIGHLLDVDLDVAVIGAGTLGGDFRIEDKLGCARVAAGLAAAGYRVDEPTRRVLDECASAPVAVCAEGPSAAYLRRSEQLYDLDFVLTHEDDLSAVFPLVDGELWQKDV